MQEDQISLAEFLSIGNEAPEYDMSQMMQCDEPGEDDYFDPYMIGEYLSDSPKP